tara:strand:- start:295 stop:1077 length:783 start_codon:yes stop_codon:yes gene_type:complete
MALDFILPIGQQVVGAAAGAVTNLTGVSQADVSLGAYRLQAVDSATNIPQGDAILTDFRIANQSVFCSNGTGFPASALQANVQAQDYIADVTLSAGTSVQMSVAGGAAVGGYDASAWICTDPISPGQLPEGAAPGDFSLSDIALLFPLSPANVPAAVGGTVVMEAVCNRTCRLGKLFITDAAFTGTAQVTSVLVGGEEQLAQSTTVGIALSAFHPLSTMNNGDFDLDKIITPGESVQITIRNGTAGGFTAIGGIYCMSLD